MFPPATTGGSGFSTASAALVTVSDFLIVAIVGGGTWNLGVVVVPGSRFLAGNDVYTTVSRVLLPCSNLGRNRLFRCIVPFFQLALFFKKHYCVVRGFVHLGYTFFFRCVFRKILLSARGLSLPFRDGFI